MNLTAIIINFLREPYIYKCIESLQEQYPDIKIIIGENGHYTKEKADKFANYGVKYIEIGWDAGICVARNKLVEEAGTDFVLIGDDDFFYTKNSKVDKMLSFLERHPEYSVIGGRIFENDALRDYQGFFNFEDDGLIYKELELDNFEEDEIRYKECDLVFNYFVGRKKDLLAVRWDEKIKVAYEHSTFFIDFKKAGYKVVFTPDAIVKHKIKLNEPIDEEYQNYRKRRTDKIRFFTKNSINWLIDMKGYRDTLCQNTNTLLDSRSLTESDKATNTDTK